MCCRRPKDLPSYSMMVKLMGIFSLGWIFAISYTTPAALRDDNSVPGVRDVHVLPPNHTVDAFMPHDENDAYSSLYCVGHRFVDSTDVAPGLEPQHDANNRSTDAWRVDVILNGLFMLDKMNATILAEIDLMGSPDKYYFPIYNRTCLYTHVYFDQPKRKFLFYLQNTSTHRRLLEEGKLELPRVSLSSRPLELPLLRAGSFRRKAKWAFAYSPVVVLGRRPCDASLGVLSDRPHDACAPYHNTLVAYFVPTVAPWNFAHTLLCDLFGFFWGHIELKLKLGHVFPSVMSFLSDSFPDVQLVATSFRYYSTFPLPNSNKAFNFMSRRTALYDLALPSGVYRGLLAGTGTKSWSWVTTSYAASGSPALWYAFRHYIIRLTGAQQPAHRRISPTSPFSSSPPSPRRLHVCMCYKRDKRGIANTEKLQTFLRERFGARDNVFFLLKSIINQSAREQVELMLSTDVFLCNEGTLSTIFFLMNPGSVFIAVPLVYHSPHLHQRRNLSPGEWWMRPDIIRVDPRYNTGGNIDWFPPSIPWVRVTWYSEIPLSEVSVQLPLSGLRNFMPDYNVYINPDRFALLMTRVVGFIRGTGTLWDVKRCPFPSPHHTNLHSSQSNGGDVSPSLEEVYQLLPVCLEPTNWTLILTNTSLRSLFYLHESDVEHRRFLGRTHRPPNYSITADQCRRLLHLKPTLTSSFNTVLCRYGMSWLCEFFVNARYSYRIIHDKWRNSANKCGGRESWPGYWLQHPEALSTAVESRAIADRRRRSDDDDDDNGKFLQNDLHEVRDYFFDVREHLNLSRFLFFNRESLLESYRMTDLKMRFTVDDDVVRKLFGGSLSQ